MKNLFKNLLVLICLLSASFGPDGGQVFAASSLPSFTAWKISSTNSSVSNLASSASFTGPSEEVSDFSSVQINFKADQNATIQQEQSNDGTNWDLIDSYSVTASTADSRSFTVMRRFFRIIVTNNGGSTTTLLRLQTVYVPVNSTIPRSLTTAGNLKVAVQEALPAGGNTIGGVTQVSGPWTSNITQIGGASLALGQAAMSASIPVVIASNQSAVPSSQSGTWTVQPGNTANTTPWLATINQGGNSATVTGSNALKVDGSAVTQPISAASLPLPSGASTSALQTTISGQLPATLGAKTIANSLAVNIASDQTVPVSNASLPLPSGASTSANQTNGTQKAQVVDGSGNVQPSGDTVGRKIFTALTDGTNTTAVKAASTAAVATDPSAVVALSPNSAIPTGTNTIGSISNISGTVSLPTGASTSALQTSGNSTLTTISGQLPATLGAKTIANSMAVNIASDQTVPISAASLPLPSGAATSANQTNGTQKSQAVDGSGNIQPSGDVLTRKIFVQPTDGTNNQGYTASNEAKVLVTPLTNSSVVKAQLQDNAGAAVVLGQTTMSASLPVTFASNQTGINTFLDKSGSGTIGALNASVTATTNGDSSVVFNISGTWVATLSVQGQNSDGNWVFIQGFSPNDNSIVVNAAANRMVIVPAGGFSQIRITATAYTSGTATVSWNAGSGDNVFQAINTNAANFLVTTTQGTSPWVNNVTQFGGTNISTGTGVSGAGIPRVTVSSDSSLTVSLPTGASTSANQTNGTQKTQVVDGSGNVAPSGDVVGRASFVKVTDGTNTGAVKAASTSAVSTDPSQVVSLSSNFPNLTASTGTAVSVGVASTATVASNANRAGLILVNTSVSRMSCTVGTAVLNSGVTLFPGGTWSMDINSFTTAAINCIAGAAASNVSVEEFTK